MCRIAIRFSRHQGGTERVDHLLAIQSIGGVPPLLITPPTTAWSLNRLIAIQSIEGVVQSFKEGKAAEYRIAGSCDQT